MTLLSAASLAASHRRTAVHGGGQHRIRWVGEPLGLAYERLDSVRGRYVQDGREEVKNRWPQSGWTVPGGQS